MVAEGSSDEGVLHLGIRVIAKTPRAAVNGIHEPPNTGHDADRQPAADDLSVGDEIGTDTEMRLGTSRADAKAGDDLVEDQGRPRLGGDTAQFVEETPGLEIGSSALHGLHQHRREFPSTPTDHLERGRSAVLEHHDVGNHTSRRTWCEWDAHRRAVAFGHRENPVEGPVIRTTEYHHLRAASDGASQA